MRKDPVKADQPEIRMSQHDHNPADGVDCGGDEM